MAHLNQEPQVSETSSSSVSSDYLHLYTEEIRDKISNNQVMEALDLLKQMNESLAEILRFRWQKLEHYETYGIISRDQAISERNDLVYGLLKELSKFER